VYSTSFLISREKILTNWDTSGKRWYALYSTAPAILDRHIIMCIPHFYGPQFLPLILQDLNMTLFLQDLKKVNPYEMQLFENGTFYFIQGPRNPPPPHTAKDVSCLLEQGQRNNVELQIKNSRRNIALSVNSIIPLQSSIYKDHKSLSLWHESQKL